MALGSFILALVWAVQLLLEVIAKMAEKNKASENAAVKFAIKCCRCCLACFEKCVKFLTEQVYIRIALTGESFCPAMKSCFFSLLKYPFIVSLVAVLGGVFMLIGTMCIAMTSTYFGYVYITKKPYYATVLTSKYFPTLVITIFNKSHSYNRCSSSFHI